MRTLKVLLLGVREFKSSVVVKELFMLDLEHAKFIRQTMDVDKFQSFEFPEPSAENVLEIAIEEQGLSSRLVGVSSTGEIAKITINKPK